MADTKISDLPAATAVEDADLVPIVQGGANKKAAASLVRGPKGNVTTSNPTSGDDTGDGYSAGSAWFNSSTGDRFVCRVATLGAAVWDQTAYAAHKGYLAARWYPSMLMQVAAGAAINSSACRLHSFIPQQRVTIAELGIAVVTGAAGLAQIAVWASDPTTKMPTGLPLAYTAATLDTTSTAFISGALNVNVTLEPGALYFFGVTTDQTTAVFGAWAGAWNFIPLLFGGANFTDYGNTAGTLQSIYFSYAHTFANNLSTLNITPASVTQVGAASIRAAHVNFKTANPTP